MTLHQFRRFPLRKIRRWNLPLCGDFVARAFEKLDRNGWMSDFLADPQILYERWWPYRAIRRKLFGRQPPRISVIVATRNNEATIEHSLRSLMRQTLTNLEIVVIDDASTDRSVKIIGNLARTDRRIQLIANERQIGTGASRNLGLQAATGEYVTFQDGDDFSMPSRLEMQYNAFRKLPEKKIVLCNYVRVNDFGKRLQINDRRVMKCIISMMFPRKEILEKVGFFLESNVSEDADFYERIKIAFGSESEMLVFRTLYEALFRYDSSFFSTVELQAVNETKITYRRAMTAQASWQQLAKRHAEMRNGQVEVYVPPGSAQQTSMTGTS